VNDVARRIIYSGNMFLSSLHVGASVRIETIVLEVERRNPISRNKFRKSDAKIEIIRDYDEVIVS